MIRLITNKKYNELKDKIDNQALKIVDLTLDNSDKDAEIDIYNQQVNYLMAEVEDLKNKLEKKSTELKNLKLVLKRNKIDYKALLKEKCHLQKKVEKLAKEMNIK